MDYNLIVEKYKKHGITDYKLKSPRDINVILGIEITKIKGVDKLKAHNDLFQKFLINFFNAWGLEYRESIKPLSVEFCSDKINGSYLKFTYSSYGRRAWLHIKNHNTWY